MDKNETENNHTMVEGWKELFDCMVKERDMLQNWQNLRPFMVLLYSLPSKKTMLEIGPYKGGSTIMFQQIFDRVITIDPFKYKEWDADIKHYSSSVEAKEELSIILDGEKLDAVFIDGDHSFAGLREDLLGYAPFVKDGGVIGFHDTQNRGVNPWTLKKEGSDDILEEIKYRLPSAPDYTYYGDPVLDLEFEWFDFGGLAALRWRSEYEVALDESLFIYPLDMVIRREWTTADAFEEIKLIKHELEKITRSYDEKIKALTYRLDIKR